MTLTKIDPEDQTDAEVHAQQENLDIAAAQARQHVAAMGEIVGLEMSEEDLLELSAGLNLICMDSRATQAEVEAGAEAFLMGRGLTSASAKALIKFEDCLAR